MIYFPSNNEEKKKLWEKQAEDWVSEGKDEVLFWSGRLAVACRSVLSSSPFSISDRCEFLSWVLDKYDAAVLKRG